MQLQRVEDGGDDWQVTDCERVDAFSTTLGHDETRIEGRSFTFDGNQTGEDLWLTLLLNWGEAPAPPTREDACRDRHL